MSEAGTYQELYATTHYGRAFRDNCPGIAYLRHYLHWLESPCLDVGCGTGETVLELRKHGLTAEGIDQVALANGMKVGDISAPIRGIFNYRSAVCIDVLEHCTDEEIYGVLANLAVVRKVAITVCCAPSQWRGPAGQELHRTVMPVDVWREEISTQVHVVTEKALGPATHLFLGMGRVTP